jgi:hypothetical protein
MFLLLTEASLLEHREGHGIKFESHISNNFAGNSAGGGWT